MSGPVCLTAIIPCRADTVDAVEAALLAVGAAVATDEPDTLGYRVVRIDGDAPTLVTHERFQDRDAMRAHNDGPVSKAFFAATQGMLGDVTVLIGDEKQDYAVGRSGSTP
ncbi:MAG: putative quinol monooxygenase [Janthinobacterium lividum]